MFKLVYRLHADEFAEVPDGFDGVEQPGGVGPDYRVVSADAIDDKPALVEPSQRFRTVRELWNLLEKLGRPDLKIAWPAAWGEAVGERASVVVPVLNLRLGLVRVRDASPETLDYARRLAGIGFKGTMTVDPPAGNDRRTAASVVAKTIRDVIDPPKPVPKAVVKPVPKPATKPA